jgi:transposase
VGLYTNPPDHALVLCVDETSQIQALDRTQPLLPMQPGDRSTASSPSLGGIPQVPRYYRMAGASGLEVHLIVDNYATHKTAIIRKWFAKRPRFHVHFTPTYGSWINLVERWFADKRIRRGVFRSVKELEAAIRQYIEVTTKIPRLLSGPEPQTRSWLALLATPNVPPDLPHEPLGQETRRPFRVNFSCDLSSQAAVAARGTQAGMAGGAVQLQLQFGNSLDLCPLRIIGTHFFRPATLVLASSGLDEPREVRPEIRARHPASSATPQEHDATLCYEPGRFHVSLLRTCYIFLDRIPVHWPRMAFWKASIGIRADCWNRGLRDLKIWESQDGFPASHLPLRVGFPFISSSLQRHRFILERIV